MLNSKNIIKSNNFQKADRIVVVLHGYGATGQDFSVVGDLFLSKELDNTIFLFPDAPYNCDEGVGKQWFPLDKMTYEELRSGLDGSSTILNKYLLNISSEYKCNNINLIGFSQGTMMCFEMLYFKNNVSKIIAYSGLFAEAKDKNIISKAKILIVHSDDDVVVPYKNALQAKERLTSLGIENSLLTCSGIGHSISIDGWKTGIEFLK